MERMLNALADLAVVAKELADCASGVAGAVAVEGKELAGEARDRCAETLTGGDDERAVRSALLHLADVVDLAADRLGDHRAGVPLSREQTETRNGLYTAVNEANAVLGRLGRR
jgi:hypothetical protein